MKIQINNLAALERLIGGDSQLEFDIRASVVDAFTKKHLKALAQTSAIKEVERLIPILIQESLFQTKQTGYVYRYEDLRFLNPKVLTNLQEIINEQIGPILYTLVDTLVKREDFYNKANELIKKATERILEVWADKNIEERINLAVNEKIKNLLNTQL